MINNVWNTPDKLPPVRGLTVEVALITGAIVDCNLQPCDCGSPGFAWKLCLASDASRVVPPRTVHGYRIAPPRPRPTDPTPEG
jgi:hypothetical protein